MRRLISYLGSILLLVLMVSCSSEQKATKQKTGELLTDTLEEKSVRYAEFFAIEEVNGHKQIHILSPSNKQDTLATYLCYPRGEEKPSSAKNKVVCLETPIKSLASLSTTELGALEVLDLRDLLVASNDLAYISDSILRERAKAGKLIEIARGMSRDNEKIILAKPEVLLQSSFFRKDKDEMLEQMGIHIVQYNAWKEASLLGRAEWLKVIALLAGEEERANRYFDALEKEYFRAKNLIKSSDKKQILYGQDFNNTWYIPGEYSYVTNMLSDAGLVFTSIEGSIDSKPKSMEYVFTHFSKAQTWLAMPYGACYSLSDFMKINEKYKDFDACKNMNVWTPNKRMNGANGNDYWESGPYHPDLVLKDLIKITQPELLPDYEPYYWLKLLK